jgi:pimeloyl-ACP methyl ester carboxylesterase
VKASPQFWIHCSRLALATAVLALLAAATAAQQPEQLGPEAGSTEGYTLFVGGTPLGRERISISTTAEGTSIVSEGGFAAPISLNIRRAVFRYAPDGTPASFELDANQNGADLEVSTTFADGTASNKGTRAGEPVAATHAVTPRTLIHANGVAASYVALGRRLIEVGAGAELRVYIVPFGEIAARVGTMRSSRMQIGTDYLDVRHYDVTFDNPDGDLLAQIATDAEGALVRVTIPAQGLDVLRDDVASATSRTLVHSNPGDEPVIIPAEGFNLGATLTWPERSQSSRQEPVPAVVILPASDTGDRDAFALGVPTLGQLAGAIADAGMLVARYDRRGHGQSGGRSESATLQDYAQDARDVVRWLRDLDGVDDRRIAVVGHDEAAWVALLAASRESRIRAVVSLAGPSSPGADWVIERQALSLDLLNLTPEERAARVARQKQIHAAVLSGEGWDEIPQEMRQDADTPWFQSLLEFDPDEALGRVRQPLLFVHGAADRQVPPGHAERLAAMARERDRSPSIELVVASGVNHLLVTEDDPNLSPEVASATTEWLTRTFASMR